jgi:hypothetical protein
MARVELQSRSDCIWLWVDDGRVAADRLGDLRTANRALVLPRFRPTGAASVNASRGPLNGAFVWGQFYEGHWDDENDVETRATESGSTKVFEHTCSEPDTR